MSAPFLPASSRLSGHTALLCGLALTRIIGWGSTYYAPSVLAGYLDREMGLGPELVFSGITILLLTGAFAAPALGKHLDVHGTRRSMCVGAVICGLGLATLALAQGPVSYLASWFVIGIGHAMTLANVGNVTVAQVMGERTRRALGLMMLVTGFSSSVFWPLAAFLSQAYGWRVAWLIFAAMQIVIVLPIHFAIPAYHRSPAVEVVAEPAKTADEGSAPHAQRRGIFWLLALIFSASGLVSWGLPLNLIALLQSSGLSQASAVGIASLGGPATLLARLVDAVAGERFPVERVALGGLALGPLACLIMVFAPGSVTTAVTFVVCFSAAMGVISVARATLPLALFGRQGFGAMLGKLAVPQNIAFAVAPLLFAVMIESMGNRATLVASAAIQLVGFLAMLRLVRLLRGT
ncbi:MFS transporter [Bosea sp. LjRoot9]|uniref:MFS transporter n=1 Tax=Bosea sp. LjRoot9 TaxID=3342341 RepID=UPI003ECD4E93